LCESNRKDVEDIKADYLKELNFHFVSNMLEVLDVALLEEKVTDAIDMTIKEENKTAKATV
jgi:ATP-dependent Lon protease